MRAVVQRTGRAEVTASESVAGTIDRGLLVLLGVTDTDTAKDALYLAEKITGLRIFEDAAGKMNLSVRDVGGEILAVSQFTLYGDCRKGKRPSFDKAAAPVMAEALYEEFIRACRERGVHVETGVFGAHMRVSLLNDGPVTILLDSGRLF